MTQQSYGGRTAYAASLHCPRCAQSGVANVSESRFPFTRDMHLTVGEISRGFQLVREGQCLADVEILCGRCGCAVAVDF